VVWTIAVFAVPTCEERDGSADATAASYVLQIIIGRASVWCVAKGILLFVAKVAVGELLLFALSDAETSVADEDAKAPVPSSGIVHGAERDLRHLRKCTDGKLAIIWRECSTP
jgi:hypothetical protein